MSTDEKYSARTIDIKKRICELESELKKYRNDLFTIRLCKILNKSEEFLHSHGISGMAFYHDDNKWNIEYSHYTEKFNIDDYNWHDEPIKLTKLTDKPETSYIHRSIVRFGISKKYYIEGENIRDKQFRIYRKRNNILQIINTDYDIELDMEEQDELINEYCDNYDLPEWLALTVFQHMKRNDWEDVHLINYLYYP
jgi:hypothetical protein